MKVKFNINKKTRIINEKTLRVAIDLGKDSNMGYCKTSNGQEVKCFKFGNNREGFNLFWNRVNTAMNKFKLERVVVGFESTGSYGEPLQHFLKDKPEVTLVQVNPKHVKRYKEVTDNSPNKTDDKDPKVIIQLMENGSFLSCINPEGAPAELRELVNARDFQKKLRVQISNRIHALVHKIFPEYGTVFKDLVCDTSRYVLYTYGSPEKIASIGVEKLTKIMREKSRGRLGLKYGMKLWQAAKDSVGVKQGVESTCTDIRILLGQIEEIDKAIEQIEAEMPMWLEEAPSSKCLLSIPGIGTVTAAAVIGETGGLERFIGQKAMMKLPGLNLYEISSGKHQGQKHITKRGRSTLRKTLFFAALNTIRPGGIMYQKYQEMISRGMKKIKAVVAISRKLLRIMYALVRDNKDYVHNYSESLEKAA